MRRLGVDLLIQPEEDVPKAKETDQIQQRAVVSQSGHHGNGSSSVLEH